MIPRMFKGVTGILNAPRAWDDATMGDCDPLPYVYDHDLQAYVSMWVPDDEEIARINAKLPIRLMIKAPPPEPGVPHHPNRMLCAQRRAHALHPSRRQCAALQPQKRLDRDVKRVRGKATQALMDGTLVGARYFHCGHVSLRHGLLEGALLSLRAATQFSSHSADTNATRSHPQG